MLGLKLNRVNKEGHGGPFTVSDEWDHGMDKKDYNQCLLCIIIYPCPTFNVGFIKPSFKLVFAQVITSRYILWV